MSRQHVDVAFRSALYAFVALGLASTARSQEEEAEHHHHSPRHDSALNHVHPSTEHVPPDPPQTELGPLSHEAMMEMMQMDDREPYGRVMLEELEWRESDDELALDGRAYYGGDYNKVLLKAEVERSHDAADAGAAELLWDRVVARWWTLQSGVRHDFGDGPSRTWAAFGVEGLAPYWFEVEATAYVGDQGRTALRLEAEYEVLLTQRLVLQPQLEIGLYGKDDVERGIGSGLANMELSARLRYEIKRELAPYIGLGWRRRFGRTADLARDANDEVSEVSVLAGIRVWF